MLKYFDDEFVFATATITLKQNFDSFLDDIDDLESR